MAPADVRVDGTVVFRNIANGEFATADVPAGSHVAELFPTGLSRSPILGPLKVSLPPETVTMVYAVGDPTRQSMRVIAHSMPLAANGADVPQSIKTGRAGLAAKIYVSPFSTRQHARVAAGGRPPLATFGATFVVLLGLGLARPRGGVDASRSRPAGEP